MNVVEVVGSGSATSARRVLLAGPIACGCLLAGAALYIAAVDPAAPGAHLPACPLYELTGLWCPGCGLTRATHAALRGHLGTAFGFNLFFPLVLGAIVVGWLAWTRAALGRAPIRWLTRVPPWSGVAVAVAFVAYGVVRNVSGFSALAP